MIDAEFLSQNASARFLGVSVPTIMRYRKNGHFKGAVQLLQQQLVLYPVHELQDFIESNLKRPYVKKSAKTKTLSK